MGRGTLYVVATPLGHLGDLTERASEVLRRVPLVAAEDTRRSRTLLHHLGADHPRLVSYHAHSSEATSGGILRALSEGDDVALVTDAGTPGISDPGAALVAEVRAAGFAVVPIPGASAVTTALSAAGLPADRYLFLGFLPRKGPARAGFLATIAASEWTTVVFEAPGRVGSLLADLREAAGGDRRAVVARELTKIHEEFVTGTLSELAERFGDDALAPRGECTVLIEGAPRLAREDDRRAREAAARLLAAGLSKREVAALLTDLFEVPRNAAYDMVVSSER